MPRKQEKKDMLEEEELDENVSDNDDDASKPEGED